MASIPSDVLTRPSSLGSHQYKVRLISPRSTIQFHCIDGPAQGNNTRSSMTISSHLECRRTATFPHKYLMRSFSAYNVHIEIGFHFLFFERIERPPFERLSFLDART